MSYGLVARPPFLGVVLCLGGLLGCRGAPVIPPVVQPTAQPTGHQPPSTARRDPSPPVGEAQASTVLRTHLMQLLPCDPSLSPRQVTPQGEVHVLVTLDAGGAVQALQLERTTADEATTRCTLARMLWWRYPSSPSQRTVLPLHIQYPLQPPSLNDHAAVQVPGLGSVDLATVAHELHRLQPRLASCQAVGPEAPRLQLLWLRLGEWGKLSDFGFSADTFTPPHAQRQRELSCLRRVLRLAHFPNPSGGEADVLLPTVLLP